MKHKTVCKIKTLMFAILFCVSLSFLDSSLRLLFAQNDVWYLSMLFVSAFCLFHSAPKMFKNALLAGLIEFDEDKQDAE